jgi:hypothetical protein
MDMYVHVYRWGIEKRTVNLYPYWLEHVKITAACVRQLDTNIAGE